uniref:Ig-like domain-containing protein n=1 Tax=Myripristis murdjan TaxID=586833 RepID=A0A667WZB5_9TELE
MIIILLLSCSVLTALIQSIDPHLISVTVAQPGDTVTFQCPFLTEKFDFICWHKQSVGRMVQTVASKISTTQTFHEEFNNPRFSIGKSDSEFNLIIRNVSREDEATYFCQGGTAYKITNLNATYLRVNGTKSVLLTQWPETESVQLGEAVTLQCSVLFENKDSSSWCSGEHSVYWFRAGSGESHPGVIHSRGNRSHECQESPSRQRSCVYTLSKSVTNSSDAGTYYCAVATCGEILFGNGTKVDTRPELLPAVIVLGVLLACCVTMITVFIFGRNRRRVCEHCRVALLLQPLSIIYCPYFFQDGEAEAVNYAALSFSTRYAKRGRKKRESPVYSVYSAVRSEHQ